MEPVPVPVLLPVQAVGPVQVRYRWYDLYRFGTGDWTCTGTCTGTGTGSIDFFFKIFWGPPVPAGTGA